MSKIYLGDVVEIILDCEESVDGQSDLYILYRKPVSEEVGRWAATGNGNSAEYTTIKDNDLDEVGIWVLQPYSDVYDVHGDTVKMAVFDPLIPFKRTTASAFLEGLAA